jgi:single-strand DNA-binding protein
MAAASVAVDVTAWNAGEPATVWLSLLAFGPAADELLRAAKGQMVAAIGKLTRGTYTAKDGTEREQWNLTAETVLTAKSATPAGKRKVTRDQAKGQGQEDAPRRTAAQRFQAPAPFDDPIGF